MGTNRYGFILTWCDHPDGCPFLASGVYVTLDGRTVKRCDLHAPATPAVPEAPCPA